MKALRKIFTRTDSKKSSQTPRLNTGSHGDFESSLLMNSILLSERPVFKNLYYHDSIPDNILGHILLFLPDGEWGNLNMDVRINRIFRSHEFSRKYCTIHPDVGWDLVALVIHLSLYSGCPADYQSWAKIFSYRWLIEANDHHRYLIENLLRKSATEDIISPLLEEDNIPLAAFLIQSDIKLNYAKPLHVAIRRGQMKIIPLLIQSGVQMVDANGITAIMRAAENPDPEILKYILSFPIDINQKDEYGETALFYAIRNERIENIRLLLAKGANTKIENNEGWTPMMEASNVGNRIIINIVVRP